MVVCPLFIAYLLSIMEPLYDVTEVRVMAGYKLTVLFADGLQGIVDMSAHLEGPIFGALRDEKLFCRHTSSTERLFGRTEQILLQT